MTVTFKLQDVYDALSAELAVREFWKRQGATSRDNVSLTATSRGNDTFYQLGNRHSH